MRNPWREPSTSSSSSALGASGALPACAMILLMYVKSGAGLFASRSSHVSLFTPRRFTKTTTSPSAIPASVASFSPSPRVRPEKMSRCPVGCTSIRFDSYNFVFNALTVSSAVTSVSSLAPVCRLSMVSRISPRPRAGEVNPRVPG